MIRFIKWKRKKFEAEKEDPCEKTNDGGSQVMQQLSLLQTIIWQSIRSHDCDRTQHDCCNQLKVRKVFGRNCDHHLQNMDCISTNQLVNGTTTE